MTRMSRIQTRRLKAKSVSFIKLTPIGFVQTRTSLRLLKSRKAESRIIILDRYSEGLKGVNDFSHLIVLYWLHKDASEPVFLKVHPRGRPDTPLVGLFATRSGNRPNRIGLSVVELLQVKGSTLKVRGLDASHGTPVLDLKPYDLWDVKRSIKVPGWWKKLGTRRRKRA
ncbi:MAG: tRNA (N6-threonylcarbamoyladenosine(37)-N6)-methyltransferase TrmO [Candidatus Bathyarchaeia archaeon]